jgi:hypothetical protein
MAAQTILQTADFLRGESSTLKHQQRRDEVSQTQFIVGVSENRGGTLLRRLFDLVARIQCFASAQRCETGLHVLGLAQQHVAV